LAPSGEGPCVAAKRKPVAVSRQSDSSVEKNRSWFGSNASSYGEDIATIDTYARIRAAIDEALGSAGELLDIGNGGVFDYDVGRATSIVALDLFLDIIDVSGKPANVTFVQGSALDIPFPDASFDTVLIVMLLHHLVGRSVDESLANVERAIAEARRALRPDGRLVIVESWVPSWFYALERVGFPVASRVLDAVMKHPVTVQYPATLIRELILRRFCACRTVRVPKGAYVLQFGVKVPSWVTPVQVEVFVADGRR
jgi:ubiquinone/menaquinone biosynthesis C-methylase UbiE